MAMVCQAAAVDGLEGPDPGSAVGQRGLAGLPCFGRAHETPGETRLAALAGLCRQALSALRAHLPRRRGWRKKAAGVAPRPVK